MGIFDKIFSKNKELKEPIDFGLIGTDIHSHLIPGIDDGSKSIDDSIKMIQGLMKFGYKKIITTPHIMSDMYPNTKEIITKGYERLKIELENRNIDVEFEVASEYFLDEHFIELIEKGDLMTFGDDMVLFELPFGQEPMDLNKTIFDMQMAGYIPVIAHPERYDYFHKNFSRYESLYQKDVILQVNINSLSGQYSNEVQKIAEKLIDRGLVKILGTDMHHQGHFELMKKAALNPFISKLVNSGRLLNKTL